MNYFMPTRLYTGTNCIAQHADALRALGSCCLIVTDRHVAKFSGALEDVASALKSCGVSSFVWDGVAENPPIEACMRIGRWGASDGAEFVLGIGGGSALDAAKAISVFIANPWLDEAGFYALAWQNDPVPIALVGTTAGTGSEVTKVSVLTDGAARKHSIHDDRLYARVAFGDSRHTHTCPRGVTLSCGIDVVAHATESYFSHKADEISRAFAVRAVRQAVGPLLAAAAGEELSASDRSQLYDASILGGLAINTTGTCFPHNVGYYLTENYGVPHGIACAVFLPAMMEQVESYDPAYAAAFYDQIGMDKDAFVGLITSCLPDLSIGMTIEQVETALPRWENNGSVKNTRADVSVQTIREILVGMYV